MNPQMLVEQASSAGIPAPHWFIQFFKALGFTLHMAPMNLWYAGLLIALWLHLFGNEHGRRFAARLLRQMPIIIAVGVNLGIVPLLFVQLAYYKVFYPATILMAWYWLAIIGLLIPAYYGVYIYAWALRTGANGSRRSLAGEGHGGRAARINSPRPLGEGKGVRAFGAGADSPRIAIWKRLAGWLAAIFFIAIGFLFANGLSLMDQVHRWPELWKQTQVAGAVLGTALNTGDPTLWLRWLLMLFLAMCTTAAWIVFDATWLTPGADKAYHQWAWGFAKQLYTLGMVWGAVVGTCYVVAWSTEVRGAMFQFPLIVVTLLTAVATGLPWVLIMTSDWCDAKRATAAAVAVSQFGVLSLNAVSRQIVQNVTLRPVLDIAAQPTDVQWGPLLMFLAVFVLGLAVVAWMLLQAAAASRKA